MATAIFGDGAAAALMSTEGEGPALIASGEHTWPASLDVMGWHVKEDGFGVLFSRDIPALVRRDFRPALEDFLDSVGLRLADIASFAMHPGGLKVVEALERALTLPATALETAREVLGGYGNMSAATVLFVLERMIAENRRGRYLLSSLGPGFTAAFLTMLA